MDITRDGDEMGYVMDPGVREPTEIQIQNENQKRIPHRTILCWSQP